MSTAEWAMRATREIRDQMKIVVPSGQLTVYGLIPDEDRIASIITTHAEPLVALLRESKREHYHQQTVGEYESRGCCGQCTCSESSGAPCTCGSDAWNARVEAVLSGLESST